MNSGKLDDSNVTIIDPNLEYKSPTTEFIVSYAHRIIKIAYFFKFVEEMLVIEVGRNVIFC